MISVPRASENNRSPHKFVALQRVPLKAWAFFQARDRLRDGHTYASVLPLVACLFTYCRGIWFTFKRFHSLNCPYFLSLSFRKPSFRLLIREQRRSHFRCRKPDMFVLVLGPRAELTLGRTMFLYAIVSCSSGLHLLFPCLFLMQPREGTHVGRFLTLIPTSELSTRFTPICVKLSLDFTASLFNVGRIRMLFSSEQWWALCVYFFSLNRGFGRLKFLFDLNPTTRRVGEIQNAVTIVSFTPRRPHFCEESSKRFFPLQKTANFALSINLSVWLSRIFF